MMDRLRRCSPSSKSRLLAVTVTFSVSWFFLAARDARNQLSKFRSDTRKEVRTWNGCDGDAHVLSILGRVVLGGGERQVEDGDEGSPLDCLVGQQRPPLHVMLVGHSRLRQVYETIVEMVPLSTRVRGEGHSPGVPYHDQPLLQPWRVFTAPNSTCLEVWPKPLTEQGDKPFSAWCSLSAHGRGIELDFRWRNKFAGFLSLIDEVATGCERRAPGCPDVLVITQGLHSISRNGITDLGALEEYRGTINAAAGRLDLPSAPGLVWMLEQPANVWNRYEAESLNDALLVLNAYILELLLPTPKLTEYGTPRQHRFTVWSSHGPVVSQHLSYMCLGGDVNLTAKKWERCRSEVFHVDKETIRLITNQLLSYLCRCTGTRLK